MIDILENKFKTNLIKEIKSRFEGSEVFHLNPLEAQGIPDLLILHKNKWAMLEGKKSKNATRRINQEFYVDKFNKLSFARFISPETKEEVLNELEQIFKPKRNSRSHRS